MIVILSESFFDVTTLPGVSYSRDPVAGFHALQAEGVSGRFFTRTLGYGTCNIELEVLTGINTHLLDKEVDLYTLDPQRIAALPSVPALLKNAGYRTVMLHTFNDSIYHRGPIMEAIGFDEVRFSRDFAAIDPKAAAASDYWWYMAKHISGQYYSDAYMTDLIIHLDQQDGDQPLLIYALTMENHSPHGGDKYPSYDVEVTSPITDEKTAGILDAAVQGAKNASDALARLTDYFREQDEPTVIIFFGDHHPHLLVSGNDSVYSALGMCESNLSTTWTEEQRLELLSTSYLIWSNDPDYLPAPAGTVAAQSSNYLGLAALEAAGVEKPQYWLMLEQLAETRLMDTAFYQLSRDGEIGPAAAGSPERELMTRMNTILKDALFGAQQLTAPLWK